MGELLYIIGLALWLFLSACPLALTHCCCGCLVFYADDFTTDNLATDYTTVSGAWAVSSGKLNVSSADALIVVNATSTNNYHRVSAVPSFTANGDTARLVAGYADSSNYLVLELTSGAVNMTAKLYKRVSGVTTQIGFTRTISDIGSASMLICCDSIGTSAAVTLGATTIRLSDMTTFATGNKCGFATGGTVTGTVSFDSLSFGDSRENNTDCPACIPNKCNANFQPGFGHPLCNDGTAPATVQVVISGIVDGTCSDARCSGLNGTFIINQESACSCSYRMVSAAFGCGVGSTGELHVTLSDNGENQPGDDDMVLAIGAKFRGGGNVALGFWKPSYTLPNSDCRTIGAVTMDTYARALTACDGSSATCTITA